MVQRDKSVNGLTLNSITFLRGLSIFLVLLSHNPFFKVPFAVVGVDIFFLISGYLITHQLYESKDSSLRVLRNFYYRRARRILPSLYIVVAAVLLYGKFFTSKEYFTNIKNMGLSSLLFVNNIYQTSLSNRYFKNVFENPLSSLWSLSVEEQIYILFPLIFLFFLKNKFLTFKVYLFLLSPFLLLLSYLSFTGHNYKYFLLWPRLIIFLIGSILYLLCREHRFTKRFPRIIYIFLILTIIILNKDNITSYPNSASILIVILTSIYLIFDIGNSKISKIFKYLGERSYNIYLVYLPVTVFISLKSEKNFLYPIALVTILILGELLYRVDTIFRYKLISPRKVLPILLAFLILISLFFINPNSSNDQKNISSTNLTVISNNTTLENSIQNSIKLGFPSLSADKYQEYLQGDDAFGRQPGGGRCESFVVCSKDSVRFPNRPFVVIVADSSARSTIPALIEYGEKYRYNVVYYNLTGCDPSGVPLDDWNMTENISTKDCVAFQAEVYKYLTSLKLSKEELFIYYQNAASPKRTFNRVPVPIEFRNDKFDKMLKKFQNLSNHITVVSPAPFNLNDGVNWANNQNFAIDCLKKNKNSNKCNFKLVNNNMYKLVKKEEIIAQSYGVKYINLSDFLCYNKVCPVVINNILIYTDEIHISKEFIHLIKEYFFKQLNINWSL